MSSSMDRAGVAYVDDFVGDCVLAVCGTGINTMGVVDAAADGVLFDDADTHDES